MEQNRQPSYQSRNYYRSTAVRTFPPEPSSKKPTYIVTAVLVGIVSIFGIFGYNWFSNYIEAVPMVTAAPAAAAEPPKPVFVPDTTTLDMKIAEIIAANPSMQISVALTDLNTGKTYGYGVSEPFLAASTAKLLTASYYLREVQQGRYALSTPIAGASAEQQLQKMIELSDNAAWAGFNAELGKPNLMTYAKEIGLQRYDSADNTMLSSDIALLVAKLYKGELLNEKHTQLLLGHMKNANQGQYIPAAVPTGMNVYHKAGWLDDRVHDVAIVESDTHAFVLAIYTKVNGRFDAAAGQKMTHDITATAVGTFIPKK